jgi:tRNA (guanine37-N1)-methyltransferase
MLRIGVVTIFPEMLWAVTGFGISARAIERGLLEILAYNPRNYAADPHRTVDDRPYGGGPGMVLMVEPLRRALAAARTDLGNAPVVCLSPQGCRVGQREIAELAGSTALIFVAGRYEGIDERFMETDVDRELSIGDYVLSGGELAAMVLIDAMARILPGAVGNAESVRAESFATGLLDYPHYTRPEVVDGRRVPEILLSGNHEQIRRWRLQQALDRTLHRRPDLLEDLELDEEQRELLAGLRKQGGRS